MRNEVGNFQSALLGKIQSALTDVGNRPGEIDVPVPSIDRRQRGKRRHMLAVGPGGAVCEPARGLLGILCNATSHDKAGRQSLQVPLKRRRQCLVEVIDVEYEPALRRGIDPEVQQVGIAAGLDAKAAHRCAREVLGHHGGRPAKERKRRLDHPLVADRHQLRDAFCLLLTKYDHRVAATWRRLPHGVT